MKSDLPIQSDQSLRALNTFGVEARARAYLPVTTPAMLETVHTNAALAGLPRLVLGGGSNLLLTGDFDGLVLHMLNRGIALDGEDDRHVFVRAQAGENWHQFVLWTLAQQLPGLENLSLIPGSVGAAPIQNIGAYGSELADYVDSVRAFDFECGTIRTLTKDDCAFGYRESIFKQALRGRVVIVAVRFALPKRWQANLRYTELARELAAMGISAPGPADISTAVIAIRSRKLPDPAVLGNAGSFFKNPVVTATQRDALLKRFPQLISYVQDDGRYKLAAGWLIEQCGWKGRSLGAAGVHERQALVLVNRGGADGQAILQLAHRIMADVDARFGVMLIPEPVVL